MLKAHSSSHRTDRRSFVPMPQPVWRAPGTPGMPDKGAAIACGTAPVSGGRRATRHAVPCLREVAARTEQTPAAVVADEERAKARPSSKQACNPSKRERSLVVATRSTNRRSHARAALLFGVSGGDGSSWDHSRRIADSYCYCKLRTTAAAAVVPTSCGRDPRS